MRHRFTVLGAIALGLSISTACDEPLSNVTGPTPNLEPRFSSIQSEIFESSDATGRAACAGCHNAAGQAFAGGLNLEREAAYGNLINVAARTKPSAIRVVPGDPNASYLVHKLEGGPDIVGFRMPRFGPPFLTEGQMSVLRRWIERGAAND
jgi:urease beta subunit